MENLTKILLQDLSVVQKHIRLELHNVLKLKAGKVDNADIFKVVAGLGLEAANKIKSKFFEVDEVDQNYCWRKKFNSKEMIENELMKFTGNQVDTFVNLYNATCREKPRYPYLMASNKKLRSSQFISRHAVGLDILVRQEAENKEACSDGTKRNLQVEGRNMVLVVQVKGSDEMLLQELAEHSSVRYVVGDFFITDKDHEIIKDAVTSIEVNALKYLFRGNIQIFTNMCCKYINDAFVHIYSDME
jgi:hypothetical protein